MINKHRRKTPEQHPKCNTPQMPSCIPKPAWLPYESADYTAWGHAAETARQEFSTLWRRYTRQRGDEKLGREVEHARHWMWYTMERTYPPGFWEGIEALKAGKTENLEIYIAFLEADLIFFGSGYVKADLIRFLKRLPLTQAQQGRLQNVVLHVVQKGFRREFRSYCHLARHVQSADWLQEVEAQFGSFDPNLALRARWILDACRKR